MTFYVYAQCELCKKEYHAPSEKKIKEHGTIWDENGERSFYCAGECFERAKEDYDDEKLYNRVYGHGWNEPEHPSEGW